MSAHSPGKLDDSEILYRLILPSHFRKDTPEIDPSAFRATEALGLSVIRARHVSRAEVTERALAYAKRWNVPPSDVSLAMARCGDIRTIALSEARGYCIYDTATEHDPAHADICRALAFPSGTPDQKARFRRLILKLTNAFAVKRGFLD